MLQTRRAQAAVRRKNASNRAAMQEAIHRREAAMRVAAMDVV